MNPENFFFLLPLLAAVGVIVGVLVVARYPDRPHSVPLARATLLLGAAFMFWLGWMAFTDGPANPVINWACVGLGLICGVLLVGVALFGRGEAVLKWIEDIRRGF
jgi:NO-binding membrane sensor protein with MHYT domain